MYSQRMVTTLMKISKDTRFQFIMAVGGEIFDVDQELSISKSADGVYAAGSGAAYALGAYICWSRCL
jgi:hypothetical protein